MKVRERDKIAQKERVITSALLWRKRSGAVCGCSTGGLLAMAASDDNFPHNGLPPSPFCRLRYYCPSCRRSIGQSVVAVREFWPLQCWDQPAFSKLTA